MLIKIILSVLYPVVMLCSSLVTFVQDVLLNHCILLVEQDVTQLLSTVFGISEANTSDGSLFSSQLPSCGLLTR